MIMLGFVITSKLRLLLKISEKLLLACQKNFEAYCEKGSLIGSVLLSAHVTVDDSATHVIDSSEMGLRTAIRI